jgi:hypothetical protein
MCAADEISPEAFILLVWMGANVCRRKLVFPALLLFKLIPWSLVSFFKIQNKCVSLKKAKSSKRESHSTSQSY